MLRASALSIVLLLAIAPDTELFCSLWCHHVAPAMARCHEQAHSNASPSLSGDDTCARMTADAATFMREDLRRVSADDVHHAVVIPRYQLPARPGKPQGSVFLLPSAFDSPPPILALRI